LRLATNGSKLLNAVKPGRNDRKERVVGRTDVGRTDMTGSGPGRLGGTGAGGCIQRVLTVARAGA